MSPCSSLNHFAEDEQILINQSINQLFVRLSSTARLLNCSYKTFLYHRVVQELGLASDELHYFAHQ